MAMQRFNVREESMIPTLVPGDEFVTTSTRIAERGNIVALPHPRRPDFWLVKRLTAVSGDTIVTDIGLYTLSDDEAWVLSDNLAAGAVDSRAFGPVDRNTLLPMITDLDEDTFAQGVELLIREDKALADIVDRHGFPDFWQRDPGFETLVLLILEQQVSLESGAAVHKRLRELAGPIIPDNVAAFAESDLRTIGLTRQKAGYVIGLARALVGGDIDLDKLEATDFAEASSMLQEIRGIGRWTAEAYLLSAERLPDVFPVTDRALQVGTGEVLSMKTVPTPDELEILSRPWRPIRSVAARLIWHAYLSQRNRVEPF
ncbi:MAG: S26 family signal peptidase [Acidimicrobiia bacterium]